MSFFPPFSTRGTDLNEQVGFSRAVFKEASTDLTTDLNIKHVNGEYTTVADEGSSDSVEQKEFNRYHDEKLEPKVRGNYSLKKEKNKRKNNRRKERKTKKNEMKSLKIIGVNAAGLMSKINSFEKLLCEEQPSIFCVQETKLKKANRIKTESTKKFTIYELNRKDKNGGGLCIGVLKDLHPAWVAQGDDEVECLAVEVWVDNFPIRVVTGYGPQSGDSSEKKQNFGNSLKMKHLMHLNREVDLFYRWIAILILDKI